jgi:hypothetical protein
MDMALLGLSTGAVVIGAGDAMLPLTAEMKNQTTLLDQMFMKIKEPSMLLTNMVLYPLMSAINMIASGIKIALIEVPTNVFGVVTGKGGLVSTMQHIENSKNHVLKKQKAGEK